MQVLLRKTPDLKSKLLWKFTGAATYSDVYDTTSKKLHGKVAIVTGAASGIGAAASRLFTQHGAKVILADIQDELGSKLCNELGSAARYMHCNVSQEDQVSSCVDLALSEHKRLDIMFNNAGITERTLSDCTNSISEIRLSEYERIMATNATGVFLGVKHAARAMKPRKTGCIINTSSMASVMAGEAFHSYTVSKHAVVGITKTAASELRHHGIRVNSISPCLTPTVLALHFVKMQKESITMQDLEELNAKISPLAGLSLTTEDIAHAALFLASDGKFISGQNLVVDGGFTTTKLMNFADVL